MIAAIAGSFLFIQVLFEDLHEILINVGNHCDTSSLSWVALLLTTEDRAAGEAYPGACAFILAARVWQMWVAKFGPIREGKTCSPV